MKCWMFWLKEATTPALAKPNFSSIGVIKPEQACPDTACTWFDSEPLPCFNYYRLAYRMSNGERRYSNIVALYGKAELAPAITEFQLYPNPITGPCRLQFESSATGTATLELVSMDGRSVFSQFLELQAGGNQFNLNWQQAGGIYQFRLHLPDGSVFRSRLVVQ